MFGTLAVFYLFLGGAGAGALAICSLLDLVLVRQPFGTSAYVPGPSIDPRGRIVDYGFLAGFLALALGVISLLFDLGRVDRALDLFLHPSPSLLTFGSYALAALCALGAFAVLVRFVYLPDIKRAIVAAVEAAAVAVAVAVMLYTGLLLQTIGGVTFWASPLIPVLFVLSSLSSGAALVFAVAFFIEHDRVSEHMVRIVVFADIAIIVLEVAFAVALVALSGASEHPGVRESVSILTQGDAALAWWFGFCACGMAAPLVIETAGLVHRSGFGTALGIVAVLVLAGAFCLRFGIVEAGVHRDPVLEPIAGDLVLEPVAAESSLGSAAQDAFTIADETFGL